MEIKTEQQESAYKEWQKLREEDEFTPDFGYWYPHYCHEQGLFLDV